MWAAQGRGTFLPLRAALTLPLPAAAQHQLSTPGRMLGEENSREGDSGGEPGKTTMDKHDPLHPHPSSAQDVPPGSVRFKASPQCPPPPSFPARYLAGGGQWQCSGLHAGACCARRGRSGPISGVATWDCHRCCLPGRQWVCPSGSGNGPSLPAPPREKPFLEGSPGPALSSLGPAQWAQGRSAHGWGNPPAPPHEKGRPLQLSPATGTGRGGGEAGTHPPSIFLPFTGKSLQPSTPLFIGNPFPSILPRPCAEGRLLPPLPSSHGGYPSSCPSLPTVHNLGGGTTHPPELGSPPPPPCAAPEPAVLTPSPHPGGVAG
ncbi:trithorax group protein osa-like [Cygnus olor]|uniref:trithorax group protein osa-like n=1 Tax=Cygnus olor TaxID=8869 RepID=UPI001ADE9225|nr:trithorax group protein osa-like [Cygnus olor]XP_040423682.1 trithorax group protein osa-like [Cygnus olor]